MKVGLAMMYQHFEDWGRFAAQERGETMPGPEIADWQLWGEYLDLYSRAESWGFDSLWSVEHHFTPYAMIPNPLQLLTYFAARTEKIDLGTMVCVGPWWHPLRLAEEAMVLQMILGDERRLKLGLGRGLARREYEGFGIGMDESRGRFQEVVDVLKLALGQERFSYEGTHFKIPETSVRPRVRYPERLLAELRGAWGSPPSIGIVAQNGLKPFLNPQKPLHEFDGDLKEYQAVRAANGMGPERPTIVVFAFCAETDEEALDNVIRYSSQYRDSSYWHYEIGGEHLASLDTYSFYRDKPEPTSIENLFYTKQIVGTPDECIRRIQALQTKYHCEEIILHPVYGAMPISTAEKSIDLLSREVLPAVHAIPVSPLPPMTVRSPDETDAVLPRMPA